MNLYFSLFIVQNFNWNLEKNFTIWHTLMSPISRSILSNFVLSARFIYATRSFSCCFFSLVSLVRVWMEQLLSRWKRKMLSVTQLFCHSRRVTWSSPSSYCKRHCFNKSGNVIYLPRFRNVRKFVFFSFQRSHFCKNHFNKMSKF